jgi:hypothetical protein
MAIKPNIKKILLSIRNANLDADDIQYLSQELKHAKDSLAYSVKGTLRVGTMVRWSSTKRHMPPTISGRVTAIKPKYVYISAAGWGNWKVPAHMLTVVEDKNRSQSA